MLLQGLESRAVGSCKLRFVSRSEDVWYANAVGGGRKRAKATPSPPLRAAPAGWLQKQPRDADANALEPPPATAPLPKMHKLGLGRSNVSR